MPDFNSLKSAVTPGPVRASTSLARSALVLSARLAIPATAADSLFPSSEFGRLWDNAYNELWQETGIDLAADDSPLAQRLGQSDSVDSVLSAIDEAMYGFEEFRGESMQWGQIRNTYVKPFINIVLNFNDAAAEISSWGHAPGSKAILVGFGVLLQATKGVSERYDILLLLFKEMTSYMECLKIRLAPTVNLNEASRKVAVDILVQLLRILVLAKKIISSKRSKLRRMLRRTKDYGKVLMGDHDLKEALARFDRLTTRDLRAALAGVEAQLGALHMHVMDSGTRLKLDQLGRIPNADFSCQDGPLCMEGTRTQILADIHTWSTNKDAPRIFWLDGMAGTGKSAIARTVSHELQCGGLLGGSFFCSRGTMDDVKQILPTLVAALAERDINYRRALLHILDNLDFPISAHSNIGLQCEYLLDRPLREAYGQVLSKFIFIIDALDECSNEELTRQLLERLVAFRPQLPVKIFLTSRPEPHIRARFVGSASDIHDILHLHNIQDDIVEADIRLYLTNRLGLVRKEWPSISTEWPSPFEVNALVRRAGTLFIYAFTAVEYVKEDPVDRLHSLAGIEFEADAPLMKPLDDIYTRILEEAMDTSKYSSKDISLVKRILWAILAIREPMTVSALAALLHLPSERLQSKLQRLHAVIRVPENDTTGYLATLHASFGDFLTNSARVPSHMLLKLSDGHKDLGEQCIAIMSEQLHFNISECPTSYLPNSEQCLAQIPDALLYACLHFPHHLSVIADMEILSLIPALRELFPSKFLYWLEALSAGGKIEKASAIILTTLAVLIPRKAISADFARDLRDMNRFIIYSREAIMTSVPHIYLSSLVFTRLSSAVTSHTFYSLPQVQVEGITERRTPALVIHEHTSLVSAVTFSPDGSQIVSGSWDKTIRVWDAQTGKPVMAPLKGHTSAVTSVAFSPDGTQIVSGSWDSTIRVWDAQTGKPVMAPLKGHTDRVTSVAFSPDGTQIISGSSDKAIRVWDAQTRKPVMAPFEGHTSEVTSVAFSPDGSQIVSGSQDWKIRVWDAQTGEPVMAPLGEGTSIVTSVAFSPDGTRITSCPGNSTIRVWDAQTGKPVMAPLKGHTNYATSVAFSPDGTRIISGSRDCTIRVWDAQTGKPVMAPLEGHTGEVTSVAFSPDGDQIVSGSWDSTIRVWDAQTEEPGVVPLERHTGWVTSIAFSPDGAQIVSGSWDSTIRVWDAQTGEPVMAPLGGDTGAVTSVGFSPDGTRIISGSGDCTIRVWDAQTGKPVMAPLEGHTREVTSITFSPDGTQIVSGSADRTIRVWDMQTGEPVMAPLGGGTIGVFPVAFSLDGTRIVLGSQDNTSRVWDAWSGKLMIPRHVGRPRAISTAFSPDRTQIVSGWQDATIRVRDVRTGMLVMAPLKGHTDWVTAVAFSSNGTQIVSGSRDRTVRVWDAQTGEPVIAPLEGHANEITSIAFSPDGTQIISGTADKIIRVWDMQTGKPVMAPLEGRTIEVFPVTFSPDRTQIVLGSQDNTSREWNAQRGERMIPLDPGYFDWVTSVALSPDRAQIISGSQDNMIRVWDAQTGDLVMAPLEGHTGWVRSVGFSPDGTQIVSGSEDSMIRVWDLHAEAPVSQELCRGTLSDVSISVTLSWKDGWIKGPHGELLLWVPPEYRPFVRIAPPSRCALVFGARRVTVDLSKSVHGTNWTQCFSPPDRR